VWISSAAMCKYMATDAPSSRAQMVDFPLWC